MNCLKHFYVWLKRFPHRRGYGVHSPSDFFLITEVFYCRLPYYDYRIIDEWYKDDSLRNIRTTTKRISKLLFRLVNFYQPQCIVEYNQLENISKWCMALVKNDCNIISITNEINKATFEQKPVRIHEESDWSAVRQPIDFLHLPFSAENVYKIFDSIYPKLADDAVCVVQGIYQNKQKQSEWKKLIADERVHISFDLYELGIVLLRKDRIKQNYIVNY